MAEKKTTTEQVLGERNFSTGAEGLEEYGVTPEDLEQAALTGKGRCLATTPEQKAVSNMIEAHMEQAWDELNDAFNADPDEVRAWVAKAGFNSVEQMKAYLEKMKPGQVITRNSMSFVKTHDNKFQTVQDYIYRLEQAVVRFSKESTELKGEVERLQPKHKINFGDVTRVFKKWFLSLFKKEKME